MNIKSRKGKYNSKRYRYNHKTLKYRTRKIRTQKGGSENELEKKRNKFAIMLKAIGRVFREKHLGSKRAEATNQAKSLKTISNDMMRAVVIVDPALHDLKCLVLKYSKNEFYMKDLRFESENYRQLHLDYKHNPNNPKEIYNPEVIEMYGNGIVELDKKRNKFELNFGNYQKDPKFFELDLKSKGKGKESYYLLLEYNPNYQTIEGIFKLKNIKELNFWKKVDLKTKVYSAVIQSIVKLYEEYNFAHSDLKTDNVMVDTSVINELNNDSNIDDLVINVKNFDFDHAMFLDELLPIENPNTDLDRNPAKNRPRYKEGRRLGSDEFKTDKLTTNEFDWPSMVPDFFDIVYIDGIFESLKLKDEYTKNEGTELNDKIKELFLTFDIWRFFLSVCIRYPEDKTNIFQKGYVTFSYNKKEYNLKDLAFIEYNRYEVNYDSVIGLKQIEKVRKVLFG